DLAGGVVLLHQFQQAGLEDGAVAVLEGLELAGVLLHAADGVADARQADARNQPHVPTANDRHVHEKPSLNIAVEADGAEIHQTGNYTGPRHPVKTHSQTAGERSKPLILYFLYFGSFRPLLPCLIGHRGRKSAKVRFFADSGPTEDGGPDPCPSRWS